jgi:hypothetical protein
MERDPRFGTKLVTRRRLVRHPRGYAGDRSVGLRNDDQLRATKRVLLGDEHDLAASRMEPVVDPGLDRVLAGSMYLLRAGPG